MDATKCSAEENENETADEDDEALWRLLPPSLPLLQWQFLCGCVCFSKLLALSVSQPASQTILDETMMATVEMN